MGMAVSSDIDTQQPSKAAASTPVIPMTPERLQRLERARAFSILAARLCADLRCKDVRLLEVVNLSPVCDVLVLATGASARQMHSVGQQVEELAEQHDLKSIHSTKRSEGGERWIAMDLFDVVVHVFSEEARDYYDLDGLWPDAPEIKWYEGREPSPNANAVDADEAPTELDASTDESA